MAGGSLSGSRVNNAIKIAQSLAVVLIVLFHTNGLLYWAGYSFDESKHLIIIFGPALLSLFFFAAGRSFRHRNKSSLHNFVINRTSSYLWIFLVWNIVYFIIKRLFLFAKLSQDKSIGYNYTDALSGLNLYAVIKFFIFPNNVTWFVYYIFIYMLIVYIAVTLNFIRSLIAAVVFFDVIAWYFGKFGLYMNLQYLEIFLLAYMLGDDIVSWIERSSLVSRLALLVAYVLSCYAAHLLLPQDFPVVSTMIRLAGLVSLIHVGLFMQKISKSRILLNLSNYVLPIYLMHSVLLYIIMSLLMVMKITIDSHVIKVLSPPIVGFTCIIACLYIFKSVRLASLLIHRPRGFRPMAFLGRLTKRRRHSYDAEADCGEWSSPEHPRPTT